jgi:undecaprenyl pyrophosphate phosphatase UppP
MLRSVLTISSIPSTALCIASTYLWLQSLAENNYWDTPHITHLGSTPAVFVAFWSAIIPAITVWLWIRTKREKQPENGV